jgi:hypothetical protein
MKMMLPKKKEGKSLFGPQLALLFFGPLLAQFRA